MTMQLALTFDAPLARNSDPSTSHAAAVAKDPACSVATLRDQLVYDPNSGDITWRKITGREVKSTAGRSEREWEAV